MTRFKNSIKLTLLLLSLSSFSSCGTIASQFSYFAGYKHFVPDRPNMMYSGVQFDTHLVGAAFYHHAGIVSIFIFPDYPLSFVLDTALLPFTFFQSIDEEDFREPGVSF